MSYSGSASVFDAALSPESWPLALEAVAETVGAISAADIVRSKETAGVDDILGVRLADYSSRTAILDGSRSRS